MILIRVVWCVGQNQMCRLSCRCSGNYSIPASSCPFQSFYGRTLTPRQIRLLHQQHAVRRASRKTSGLAGIPLSGSGHWLHLQWLTDKCSEQTGCSGGSMNIFPLPASHGSSRRRRNNKSLPAPYYSGFEFIPYPGLADLRNCIWPAGFPTFRGQTSAYP